ncbi:hypothetical protein PAPYR_12326 [Paratrimastix pyriformis]|uniref:Uncharacterized protein n=1 Tax=Paratrimastix pyriformis TaxID=342808 RepID=A0ABQ8U8V9_9EUKA|nr:hypothetical protein PAPYR_12326 [Paratrimastix pyriformis]
MYVDPDPEVPPLNPNDPEYPLQMQPHAILDSLPFRFCPTHIWTLTPKCLRSTPMTPNTPHRCNHTILDSLPFSVFLPLSTYTCMDPDPPEVPPLNPNDPGIPPTDATHAILDSLPFSVFCPFRHTCMWTLTPEVPPLNPNDPNTPHRCNHTRSLTLCPFPFSALSTYMWTLTPKCLRSTPMTPNTRPSPQMQPHAIP